MKKNLSFFLAVVSLVGFAGVAHARPEPADPGEYHGSIGVKEYTPTKRYVIVRYAEQAQNALAIYSGDVVVWDSNSDDGVTVDVTTNSFDGAIAGIAVTSLETADSIGNTAADHAGRRNYGVIQVYGRALANIVSASVNSAAVGDPFGTSKVAGQITTFEAFTADEAGVITEAIEAATGAGGFFYDTPASGDRQAEVFIRLE